MGLLLLRLFAVQGPLGREALGVELGVLLSLRGAALAAAVMSAPLVVRTSRVAFEGVDPRLESMARTLGYGRWRTFLSVTLPLAGRGLLAGAILAFARSVGEFGATVTVAGNIPGRTQTLASAIYQAQQGGDDARVTQLVWISLGLGCGAVWCAEVLAQRSPGRGRS